MSGKQILTERIRSSIMRGTTMTARWYFLVVLATDRGSHYDLEVLSWWREKDTREPLPVVPEPMDQSPMLVADSALEVLEKAYAIRDAWQAKVEAQS